MGYESIVIGGGVIGSAIALRLAQAGRRTLVLERSIPGAEASSAAAGILGPQIEGHGPDPLFQLGLESREAYPSLAEELRELAGIDVGFTRCGLLHVAMEGEDPAPWEARFAWQRQAGVEVERLSGDEVRALEPGLSPRISLALHFPREGRVDPRALARALPLAAERAGAHFRAARVLGVAVESGRVVGVDVEGERIPAANVVVAAGAWTSLVQGLPLPAGVVEPLRGQMVELADEGLSLGRIVFSSRGYVVPRGEGRVVAGSTMERAGFDKRVTAEGVQRILDQAIATLPSLAKAEPRALWAGLRPCPADGLPLIGETEVEGLFVCSGHHRNGILLTPISAALLARAVIEGKEPEALSPFSPRRFSRPVSPEARGG